MERENFCWLLILYALSLLEDNYESYSFCNCLLLSVWSIHYSRIRIYLRYLVVHIGLYTSQVNLDDIFSACPF